MTGINCNMKENEIKVKSCALFRRDSPLYIQENAFLNFCDQKINFSN